MFLVQECFAKMDQRKRQQRVEETKWDNRTYGYSVRSSISSYWDMFFDIILTIR